MLKEGQISDESYFVIKGCLRSYYIIEGDEKTTAFYVEFEAINPACIISKKPSEYYINCVEDCTLLVSNPAREQSILSVSQGLKPFVVFFQKSYYQKPIFVRRLQDLKPRAALAENA